MKLLLVCLALVAVQAEVIDEHGYHHEESAEPREQDDDFSSSEAAGDPNLSRWEKIKKSQSRGVAKNNYKLTATLETCRDLFRKTCSTATVGTGQKCLDCGKANRFTLMKGGCFVSQVYEICESQYTDLDSGKKTYKNKAERLQHCDLLVHDFCRDVAGWVETGDKKHPLQQSKGCYHCVAEHWKELENACEEKPIAKKMCIHIMPIKREAASKGATIEEERVDDGEEQTSTCYSVVSDECGLEEMRNTHAASDAVKEQQSITEHCISCGTKMLAGSEDCPNVDVIMKGCKEMTPAKLENEVIEEREKNDKYALKVHKEEHDRFAKYCRSNVDTMCSPIYKHFHYEQCMDCAHGQWKKLKKYCDPTDHFAVLEDGDKARHTYMAHVCSPTFAAAPTAAPTVAKTDVTCEENVDKLCTGTASKCMQCVSANWEPAETAGMSTFCADKNEAFDVCATHLQSSLQYCSKLLFRKGCLKGIMGTAADKLTCQNCAVYVSSAKCTQDSLKNTCVQYYTSTRGALGDERPGALRRRL